MDISVSDLVIGDDAALRLMSPLSAQSRHSKLRNDVEMAGIMRLDYDPQFIKTVRSIKTQHG